MLRARVRRWAAYTAVLAAGLMVMASCSTVPVTGRSQLSLVPDSMVHSMSFDQYNQFLSESEVVERTAESRTVKEVGRRIQQAVERFAQEEELDLEGYEWEFNLVRDEQVNAWAMPGGKVVVYTGLLPVAQDENGLATVMGHEIAHAIAKHGSERMSQGLVTQMGAIALSQALSQYPAQTQQLFMQSYEVGTQVGVMLPYSRTHELEADRLGLIFMSLAGYDPAGAVEFWQRMARQGGGGRVPEFLSTHPASERRIEEIQEMLPGVKEKYYRPRI